MKLKQPILSMLIATSVLVGCSSWFYGESNLPKPVDLPKLDNPIVTTEVLWEKSLGAGGADKGLMLRPSANRAGNIIYVANNNGKIYGFDAQTGVENFSVNIGNDITSPLTEANNYLFFGTKNGDLMAISTTDGKPIWRQSLGAMLVSAPVIGEGILVAYASDGSIHAFSPSDGTLLWRYHTHTPTLSLRGNAEPIVGGGVVIITTDDGFFTVLDGKSGLPVANNRVIHTTGKTVAVRLIDQDASPQVNGNTLFGAANDTLVYAVDLQAGAPKWENKTVSTAHDFAISPTDIYLSTLDGQLIALNQADGHELWRSKVLAGRQLSPPIAIPGRVGVVDYEGYLHWFDSQTGKLIGQKRIGKTSSVTRAIVLQNEIIWQLKDGRIVAFRPQIQP